MADTARPVAVGAFAPLRLRMFAVLLAVQLANAMAVWVHVVTVQWTLTARGESATVISAAPAAMALPFLLLALPVGAVAGFASRERMLFAAMVASALSASAAALLSAIGADHAAVLIGTVILVGSALVVIGVAWQSLLPDLVNRELLPAAVVLDGTIYNVARAVGPLAAGIGLGLVGPTWTFLGTSVLFALGGAVLLLVELRRPGRRRPRRPVFREIAGGLRFARFSPWTQGLLLRMVMFGLPASALWALISLVVHDRLGLASQGFGVVMGLVGTGAVVATFILPPLRRRASVTAFAAWGSTVYAATLLTMGLSTEPVVVGGVLVLGGVAWVGVQSTWMMLAHQALPDWVRPRIIALLLLLFQGTQAIGSLLWGVAADLIGLPSALAAATGLMVVSIVVLLRAGLGTSVGIEPYPAEVGDLPQWEFGAAEIGPLEVRYEYHVEPDRRAEFAATMEALRLSRLRLGARGWWLRPDPGRPGVCVETYVVSSWEEFLQQESGRLTVPEQRLRTAAREAATEVRGPHTSPVHLGADHSDGRDQRVPEEEISDDHR